MHDDPWRHETGGLHGDEPMLAHLETMRRRVWNLINHR